MIDISIRRCGSEDAHAVAALATQVFAQAYGPTHPEPELSRYIARHFSVEQFDAVLRNPTTSVLLVEDADRNGIAYAQISEAPLKSDAGPPDARSFEIQRFYVVAAWHGRGVADRLMDASLAEIRRNGGTLAWLQVWKAADRAVAFYRRAGFVIVGTATFEFSDRVEDDHLMSRRV